MSIRHTIAAAACALTLATSAQAQTAPAPKPYAYSVSLSITAPKGSASDAVAKDKSKPAGLRYTPCLADQYDQLGFTIKYDAGKLDAKTSTDQRQNVYLIFYQDGYFFPLVRQRLTSSQPFFAAYTSVGGIKKTDTYTDLDTNLGGAQTEGVLGSSLVLEGLPRGLWTVTAIVAKEAGVDFDDPSTWSAWDTVPFMLGKPWLGADGHTSVCQ